MFLEIGCTIYLVHRDSGKEMFLEIGCTICTWCIETAGEAGQWKQEENSCMSADPCDTFLHLFLDDSKDALGCIGTVAGGGAMETTEDSCISADLNAHILSNCTHLFQLHIFCIYSWMTATFCRGEYLSLHMSKEEQNTTQETDLLLQIIHSQYWIYIAK